MKEIIIRCRSCEDINKAKLGMPGFEVKETEFESLTHAWEHLINQDYHHDMVIELKD